MPWVRLRSGRVQVVMDENFNHIGPRERQIIDLLLQGCDNGEIARDLNMAERTVKAYFNRLFVRFGIKGGIKQVKLATYFIGGNYGWRNSKPARAQRT